MGLSVGLSLIICCFIEYLAVEVAGFVVCYPENLGKQPPTGREQGTSGKSAEAQMGSHRDGKHGWGTDPVLEVTIPSVLPSHMWNFPTTWLSSPVASGGGGRGGWGTSPTQAPLCSSAMVPSAPAAEHIRKK